MSTDLAEALSETWQISLTTRAEICNKRNNGYERCSPRGRNASEALNLDRVDRFTRCSVDLFQPDLHVSYFARPLVASEIACLRDKRM
jgi:hypothetical protein